MSFNFTTAPLVSAAAGGSGPQFQSDADTVIDQGYVLTTSLISPNPQTIPLVGVAGSSPVQVRPRRPAAAWHLHHPGLLHLAPLAWPARPDATTPWPQRVLWLALRAAAAAGRCCVGAFTQAAATLPSRHPHRRCLRQ